MQIADRRIRRLWCLVVGHKERHSYNCGYIEDYCDRCWYTDSDIDLDETTLPRLLNRFYVWLVKRDWAWWERFDQWFMQFTRKHKHIRLPSWWEY